MTAEPTRRASLAPVAIFGYARATHLRRCVESLLANEEALATDVVFFCDAPKAASDQARVDEVRSYVDTVRGFGSVTRVYRDQNFGLARSIREGVASMLARHGRVIVLEDDLVLSPYFLRYMNDGLERYAQDERVASIHGYVYPVEATLPETFFLRGADCWGWGTWSRAWSRFNPDGPGMLRELRSRGLCREFDYGWQYPYVGMLRDQIAGKNQSWAILWHASCFLDGLLTLYPGRSLVQNIGNDSSGTHCGTSETMSHEASAAPVEVGPIEIEVSDIARQAFEAFHRRRNGWRRRVRNSVKRLLTSYA